MSDNETLQEKRRRAGRLGGKAPHSKPTGVAKLTLEQRSINGRKGYEKRMETLRKRKQDARTE